MPAATLEIYPIRLVGNRDHAELWIPADELEAFNASLVGPIEIAEIWWPPVNE